MSAIEETKNTLGTQTTVRPRNKTSVGGILAQGLELLSSVRFGIIVLILLVIACMAGMLIMQQSVDGFDKYYADLNPSQQILGGALGLFDVYHAWYFNALLLILSLNIVLASIDRFPGAWRYLSRPKLEASRAYILHQKTSAVAEMTGENAEAVAEKISAAFRQAGFKARITERQGRLHVFGQRGTWNRLGAYAVHVALLTTFFGGFLTAQFGRTGQMQLIPGEQSNEMQQLTFSPDQISRENIPLPFTVVCTDIQQKLIKKEGPITSDNTIDWLTKIKITDQTGAHEALVHLNEPVDYRGYRFFQASFISLGMARNITLRLTPDNGGQPVDVQIPRDGTTTLSDGTQILFEQFLPDFTLRGGKADTASGEYNNPAAILKVRTPAGEIKQAFAFTRELPSGAPVGAPVGGYKFRIIDFEKVPLAHVLSIQHDPGSRIVYLGFTLLILTLCLVFFFSHQRVWAVVEDQAKDGSNKTLAPGQHSYAVALGGQSNRNKLGFDDRFKKLAAALGAELNQTVSEKK